MDLNKNKLGEIYILLQMDCELKCNICPYLGIRGACNNKEFKKKYVNNKKLDLSILKKFIDEIISYKPKLITLSGGEPLNYKNWVELAKYIKSKNLKLALSTNGLNIDKYLKEVILYVDSINLNLGGTKDILPKIRHGNYEFDKVIKNIKKINYIKKVQNLKKPKIRIIYVISDISYLKIKEFYDYFRINKINVNNFYFQHLIYITKENLEKQKKIWEKFNLSTAFFEGFCIDIKKINFDLFFNQIKYLTKFKKVVFSPKMSLAEIKNYYTVNNKDKIIKKIKCKAPWNQVDLYPNGDIMVCPDFVIGNIYKNSFNEIWNGKKVNFLRNLINKNKKFPGCNSCFYYYVSNED